MSVSSALARLVRWIAPSAVAACAGALVAGTVEALGVGDGAFGLAAALGFFALLAVPVLLAGGVFVRGMWLAWQPRQLGIVEPDGSAPRLAGWLAVFGLGALVVAWLVYRGTWMLVPADGELRPHTTAFAEPAIALIAAIVVFAASRPAARLFAELARRADLRWRRAGRATLLRPRAIAIAAIATAVGAVAFAWLVVVRPRIGAFDTSVFHAPVLAIAIAIVAHAARRRIPALGGGTVVTIACAAMACACAARSWRPALALEIWGDRPIAGLAIDTLYDLEDIRADISLAEFRPVDRPNAQHPDIILVTIDTVRADHTPPYGGNATMPMLRALGERGTVFEWAFAPSNVTRRSLPAIAIGLSTTRIRGRVVGWGLRVDPRHVLLAERLAAGGYDTAGFMSLPNFFGEEARTGMQRGLAHLAIEPNGHRLAKLASTWLAEREATRTPRPLFLWIHILEPHNWTVGVGTPRNDDERSAFYDRSLVAADQMVSQLLRPLAARTPGNAPIVIVTADHGEALGEHGHDYHSTDLYNSQMRVPLVIAGPGIATQVAHETVSLVDLVPTIVELAGFEPPRDLDGRSLADVLAGKRSSPRDTGTAFAAMIKDRSNPGGVTAFVAGRWKLIDNDGTLELYDIYADPDERTSVAADHPDLVRELTRRLAEHAAGTSPFR